MEADIWPTTFYTYNIIELKYVSWKPDYQYVIIG